MAEEERRQKEYRRAEDRDLLDEIKEELHDARILLKKQLQTDFFRVVGGFLLMCALFWPDLVENLIIFKYVAGFLIGVGVITHITRRILFPYINLTEYAKTSLQNPIAAAIVFFGVCVIIAVTITASAGFFSR